LDRPNRHSRAIVHRSLHHRRPIPPAISQPSIDFVTEFSPASGAENGSQSRSGIDDLRPYIERALENACKFGDGCPPRLAEAIRYALLSGGKRLRPCLVLMAAEVNAGSFGAAIPGAVAVEMIHSYSLIHDDLPAMDDDDLRRGRPTVHVAFDEATAILAGDALQSMAFGHLADGVADPAMARTAISVLARASGAEHLVGGQADDLSAEGDFTDPEGNIPSEQQLESIHRRKTGALFAASLDIGAVLSSAGDDTRLKLGNYARDLGLAFQVADDLLDHTASESELGKRTGRDASRGKLTYPGRLGVEASRRKVAQLVESAHRHVAPFGESAWRLHWLADYVLERAH
jgi:geranylgeranyl diphosphate synthase type II